MWRNSLLALATLASASIVCSRTTLARCAGISHVEVAPRALTVASGHSVRIRFYLAEPSSVTLGIQGDDGGLIWSRTESFRKGYGAFHWDGHSANGDAVSDGIYGVMLTSGGEAGDGRGPVATDQVVPVYDLALDHATGIVSYRLSEPAKVQVRIGIGDGGPLLRTLGAVHGEGNQAIQWDGWDESRIVNLLGDRRAIASVRATSLPEYSIVVGEATSCHSPPPAPFHVQFRPRSSSDTTAGRDVLVAEVHIERDSSSLLGRGRYEWLFFVDGRFVFEEEKVVTNPYVFKLDLTSLQHGEHVLTVNLAGQEDDVVWSASERFKVTR